MAKINKQVKQIDAATRLVLGGKREASVVVAAVGSTSILYSAGYDAAAPAPGLPGGVYSGAELLAVYPALKHAENIVVGNKQIDDTSWVITLADDADRENTIDLAWRNCKAVEATTPPTEWTVSKDLLDDGKRACAIATKLQKKQLRLLRFYDTGIMRLVSPVVIADWYYPECSDKGSFEVYTADFKRAANYRGGKLSGIGTSDGKINFVFTDGAFLRVDKFDEATTIHDDAIEPQFSLGDDAHYWPLSEGRPGDILLSLIESGASRSCTPDGMVFHCNSEDDCVPVNMPVQTSICGFTKALIMLVADKADYIMPTGPATHWKKSRILFCGCNYRAVIAANFTDGEAMKRGMLNVAAD